MGDKLDKAALEEEFEVAADNIYSVLYGIVKMLEAQQDYIVNKFSAEEYEKLYTHVKALQEELDAFMEATYKVLPLYMGEQVATKQLMEVETKYFDYLKELHGYGFFNQ